MRIYFGYAQVSCLVTSVHIGSKIHINVLWSQHLGPQQEHQNGAVHLSRGFVVGVELGVVAEPSYHVGLELLGATASVPLRGGRRVGYRKGC